ncbi:unnamed protein product [Allacma fusca]|uniref:DUF4789 domain-containing protein n=1 Tax=Allacma fusca TaxID=39272 RepID=A0A8J2J7L9_9HEXA|nr:unnamed protein product [Allacma fusca]
MFPSQLLFQAVFIVSMVTITFFGGSSHSHLVPENAPKQLCRKSHRLYFNQTRKCYRPEERGPCPELMMLIPCAENKFIGVCGCEVQDNPECQTRPLVFVKESSRCFALFHQGPCKNGEWLVVGSGNASMCEKIPCPQEYNAQPSPEETFLGLQDTTFVFADNGKCYKTSTKGQWRCKNDEYVYFNGLGFNPVCMEAECPVEISEGGEADNDCKEGSEASFSKDCEPLTQI